MENKRLISLTKQTLKYVEIPSLGIYIEKFHLDKTLNEVNLIVRYVDLTGKSNVQSGAHALTLPVYRFMKEFYIDIAGDGSAEANWKLVGDCII